MASKKEGLPYEESGFQRLLKSKEIEGWQYGGAEKLTETKFVDQGLFKEVPHQTEDSIKDKYLQAARQQDPSSDFEVDLVLDENTEKLQKFREISTEEEYRDIVGNLREGDREYFVFVRRVRK